MARPASTQMMSNPAHAPDTANRTNTALFGLIGAVIGALGSGQLNMGVGRGVVVGGLVGVGAHMYTENKVRHEHEQARIAVANAIGSGVPLQDAGIGGGVLRNDILPQQRLPDGQLVTPPATATELARTQQASEVPITGGLLWSPSAEELKALQAMIV